MHVLRVWRVLCVLGTVASPLCANELDYEDNYNNEISQDQQEGESPTSPCHSDFSRWDRLFIAMEDSHMRQNMLLQSAEQCCGGISSLRTRVDKLAEGTCQQCVPSLESACRAQAEQASLRLQQGLVELREEEAERERRLNATLEMLLRSRHEENARLKRLEKAMPSRPGDSRVGQQPTQRPAGLGAAFSLGVKEQEVTTPLDVATMERVLVAVATELQRIHLKLIKLIEQAGTLRKDRGDA
ncbi:pentraxin-related protein PTX3-like [Embiotoca jacksoni]|uniref:pentraxin-related protein PTX3-like n=1 Tax=Embiotoca jacksoni TaxID=100190 RepID=UPI003703F031